MTSIGLPELLVIVGVGVLLLPGIFYLTTLQRALERCSPQARTMSPGQVWLMLIPVFNVIWQFLMVGHIARSLRNEFQSRGIPVGEAEPAKGIGLAMSILLTISVVPEVGIFAAVASMVCWIIYWAKVAEYSSRLIPPTYSQPLYPNPQT